MNIGPVSDIIVAVAGLAAGIMLQQIHPGQAVDSILRRSFGQAVIVASLGVLFYSGRIVVSIVFSEDASVLLIGLGNWLIFSGALVLGLIAGYVVRL